MTTYKLQEHLLAADEGPEAELERTRSTAMPDRSLSGRFDALVLWWTAQKRVRSVRLSLSRLSLLLFCLKMAWPIYVSITVAGYLHEMSQVRGDINGVRADTITLQANITQLDQARDRFEGLVQSAFVSLAQVNVSLAALSAEILTLNVSSLREQIVIASAGLTSAAPFATRSTCPPPRSPHSTPYRPPSRRTLHNRISPSRQ